LACGAYATYLGLVLPWLFHQMEFEADIYACQERSSDRTLARFDAESAEDMVDALLRLAAFSPSQFERKTLLHPSIQSRIEMIQSIKTSPIIAQEFCQCFKRRRRFVLAGLITACLVTLAV
jgi:hypothetical protein